MFTVFCLQDCVFPGLRKMKSNFEGSDHMNDLLTLSSLAIREIKPILLIGDRNFFPGHKRQSLAQFLP